MDFGNLLNTAIQTGGQIGIAAIGGAKPTAGQPQTGNSGNSNANPAISGASTNWLMYGIIAVIGVGLLVMYFAFKKGR